MKTTSRQHTPGFGLLLCALFLILSSLRPSPALALKPDRGQFAKLAGGSRVKQADCVPGDDQLKAAGIAATSSITTHWNSRLGTPSSVRGKKLGQRQSFSGGKGLAARGNGAFGADAIAVVDNLSRFYRIRDAEKEFRHDRTAGDALGNRHLRLAQMHEGLRVVGGQLIVHFDGTGDAYEVNGNYVPDIAVSTTPRLGPDEAVDAALAGFTPEDRLGMAVARDPELVVLAWNCSPKLAYELVLATKEHRRWRCWIDAANGAILLCYDDVRRVAPPTDDGVSAQVSGSILAGEGGYATNVVGWYENTGVYYLYNKLHYWYVVNSAGSGYTDSDDFAWRASSNWGTSDRAEMSAGNNFSLVQEYFWTIHGRNSYDNAGAYARANVHEGVDYVNAYWDGTDFHFGDGDDTVAYALAVLDVIGHEYTHAVTEHEADLYYYGESGALNESFSDIFGACVEFHCQPDGRALYPGRSAGKADWLLGEDCWISSKALRDMRNPANTSTVGAGNELPSYYKGTYWYYGSDDNGGVHINSGVQNFFFYLLSEGGTGNNDGVAYSVAGIGVTNAEKVAYLALTAYCGPYTDYAAAREAWVSAATDINPAWVSSVQAAWNACGAGAVPPAVATPTFNPPGGAYGSAVTVTVATATADASVYYTMNGSDPTESSTPYTVPLVISSNSIVKARAFKSGMQMSLTASATYTFLGTRLYYFTLDSSPGWTVQGPWAFGQPTGGGGEHGSPDPSSGYSGLNVYGFNLAGDYANGIGTTYWLTTTPMDLSSASSVKLVFRRWLNVERPAYDHASIEVSDDGSTWTRVWENSAEVVDSSWTRESLDISSVAARQGTVYVRWGMGPTDGSWAYSGWNIDDIEIWDGGADDGTLGVAMEAPELIWTAGGDADWYAETTVAHDGVDAAQSGDITDNQVSWLQTSVLGHGTISFWWKVSSEQAWDYMRFYIDGVEQAGSISGVTGWVRKQFHIAQGSHTLMWAYTKDDTVSEGSDCGWVDEVVWQPGEGVEDDFDGDGKAEIAAYWPGGGTWYVKYSGGGTLTQNWGWNAVVPATGDYDGDGKTDIAVYWPARGTWYIRYSGGGTLTQNWGWSAAMPVPGDYDGDGKTDIAVYWPASGTWYIKYSGGGTLTQNWGWSAAVPVPGDYDGDDKTDIAVYWPARGTWYVRYSGGGTLTQNWGWSAAMPVPGDYDGDGKTDIAVYWPASGTWYIRYSGGGTLTQNWGWSAAMPVAGDYDGDGVTDMAVYYAGSWSWYVKYSGGSSTTAGWGRSGAIPTLPQYQINRWMGLVP